MKYEHKTYGTGSIMTTIDGLRQLFPSLADKILDDMTDDELNALDLPFDDSDIYKQLEKSQQAMNRAMRETCNQLNDAATLASMPRGFIPSLSRIAKAKITMGKWAKI